MPFAVIGSEKDVKTPDGRVVKGRQYSWGVAEVENEDHCDFKKLRSILIRTHMLDLIHTTEEQHYEVYRAQQMETRKFGEARPRKLDNPKFKEEEEALRKRFTEQVKIEEQRFRQWEQKLISERDRLNKDLEATHAAYVTLDTLNYIGRYMLTSFLLTVSKLWRWNSSRCKEQPPVLGEEIRTGRASRHCLELSTPSFLAASVWLLPSPLPYICASSSISNNNSSSSRKNENYLIILATPIYSFSYISIWT